MKELKITDRIYLRQDGNNVAIFEKAEVNKVDSNKKPTGETYIKNKDIAYCGTVYQALQNLLRSEYDIEKDLLLQFKELVASIDKAEIDIKNRFRIEVKTSWAII